MNVSCASTPAGVITSETAISGWSANGALAKGNPTGKPDSLLHPLRSSNKIPNSRRSRVATTKSLKIDQLLRRVYKPQNA